MKEITIGTSAPFFTLLDDKGISVSLAKFLGKQNIVLMFYPGDMTPGCTVQLCAIRDDWQKFLKTNTVVFGINSADSQSHTAFMNKYHFPFSLLSDKTKKVSGAYGALRTFLKLKLIRRTVVIIDKMGKIAYIKRGMPKNIDLIKILTTLK
jgi:peroxiredoxin Q/BCP